MIYFGLTLYQYFPEHRFPVREQIKTLASLVIDCTILKCECHETAIEFENLLTVLARKVYNRQYSKHGKVKLTTVD